jgi:sec-independent protein translocase protein TatB
MLDVGYSELLLVAIVALLVVGPKELPTLLRTVGRWVAQARSVARQFRAGFDEMVREAEIAEMNRKWEAQNAQIMASSASTYKPAPAPVPTMDAASGAAPAAAAQLSGQAGPASTYEPQDVAAVPSAVARADPSAKTDP